MIRTTAKYNALAIDKSDEKYSDNKLNTVRNKGQVKNREKLSEFSLFLIT